MARPGRRRVVTPRTLPPAIHRQDLPNEPFCPSCFNKSELSWIEPGLRGPWVIVSELTAFPGVGSMCRRLAGP